MDIVTYALLNRKIKDYASNVDEWLEENVDPATGYVLDRSLQMENAAAPADMVGDINDEVGELKNTINSEIATRQTYARPNLLDNWYFVGGGSQLGNGVFPINQRAQTTYSGSGYMIDRWKADVSGSVTINTDSISFLQVHNYDRLSQVINVPQDLPITFTAIVKGGNNGRISFWDKTTNSNMGFTSFTGELSDWTLLTRSTVIPSTRIQDVLEVRIQGTTGENEIKAIQIKAVKLELGSDQTLAHNEGTEANPVWVLNEIPDYGEQLLKCQRYFQTFRTQSLRPTYGEDCRPVMATASPATGTITKDNVTYYTLSSEP